MQLESFLKIIPKIAKSKLTGTVSHLKMIPPNRKLAFTNENSLEKPREAAIICLLYPDNTGLMHFVLILRKMYEGVHANQIGFPGGKIESTDKNVQDAALRELEEEIGVPREKPVIIKQLSEVYIPPSNFMVYPFLAYLTEKPQFIKDDYEVAEIIAVPLNKLLNSKVKIQSVKTGNNNIEVPTFLLNNHIVWGATAMILSEVKDLLIRTKKLN